MASKFQEEGDIGVLKAIAEHADAIARGEKSSHRPWLLILGGGIRGIYGAAAATQLEASALTEGFEGCVGVSTGAAACAYFLSKQGALGTTFYYEECIGRDFFSPWRMVTGGSGADVSFISRAMRGKVGLKQLDERRVRAAPEQLFVAVTSMETGKGELIDAKKAEPDIVQAIEASLALPNFYRKPVFLGEKQYQDGGVALPFPAQEIIETFKPSHLLVLANRPQKLSLPFWYRTTEVFFSFLLSSGIRKAARAYENEFTRELEYLRSSLVPYLIVWTDDRVSTFTQNKQVIRDGMAAARTHMRTLLQRVGA